jgi:hypothetical protein
LLEVVFYEGVQHCLPFYLNNLSCSKMAVFHSYLQSGKQRKVGWMGDNSNVMFGQKFPGEKVNVKWSVGMMQEPVLFVAKFQGEVFT